MARVDNNWTKTSRHGVRTVNPCSHTTQKSPWTVLTLDMTNILYKITVVTGFIALCKKSMWFADTVIFNRRTQITNGLRDRLSPTTASELHWIYGKGSSYKLAVWWISISPIQNMETAMWTVIHRTDGKSTRSKEMQVLALMVGGERYWTFLFLKP